MAVRWWRVIKRSVGVIYCIFVGLSYSASSYAVDIIKANIGESTLDRRIVFKREVLRVALESTRDVHGDYEIEVHNYYMNAKRGFIELLSGDIINVYYALTMDKWEELAIPIRIPVRMGLVSYRLLLIHEKTLGLFSNVESTDDLKLLRAGLNDGWSTYEIMRQQDFNIVKVADYDGMFNMLSVRRYDYLLRGVNEVFGELDERRVHNPNIMIEPNLAVHIPSATYIFVSKKTPKIAARLELGLNKMVASGELGRVFDRFYGDSLRKAALHKRKILQIGNPQLPKSVPLHRKELWFNSSDFVDSKYALPIK